jgi:hypothetical protein
MSVSGLMPPRRVKCYYTANYFGLLLASSFCKRQLYNFRGSLSNIDRWQFYGIYPQVYLRDNFSPQKIALSVRECHYFIFDTSFSRYKLIIYSRRHANSGLLSEHNCTLSLRLCERTSCSNSSTPAAKCPPLREAKNL